MSPLVALLVFASGFATDVVWARYTLAVSQLRRAAAVGWSVGIFLCGAIGIVAYTENSAYLAPLALGGAAGTFVAVTHAGRGRGAADG